MKMTPEFKEATLYTCDDAEMLTHECWEDAIMEKMEADWEKDETTIEQCERIGDVKVSAYNRTPISPTWVEREVSRLMETFEERFDEEFGGPDHEAQPWTEETRLWAHAVLSTNLTKSLRQASVWSCEQVGTHTFTSEECLEIVK